jgi:hypothetical protein
VPCALPCVQNGTSDATVGGLFLVEGVADLKSGRFHCTVKAETPALAAPFIAIVKEGLRSVL